MNPHRITAFTLIEMMLVVAILGILGAIAIPNFVKNLDLSRAQTCIGNMRQIHVAAENYRTAKALQLPESVESLVGPANYISKMPICPKGGTYLLTPDEEDDTKPIQVFCSYGQNHLYKYGETD